MPCTVVFQGCSGENQTSLVLGADAGIVAAALGENLITAFVGFEDREGRTIWINPANVLYIEPQGEEGS
jgi:hypothetical protein